MKKVMICAAFIAAMGIFNSANAQDIKKDRKGNKTESCCHRKSNCPKNENCCTMNNACTRKQECSMDKCNGKCPQQKGYCQENCCDNSGLCMQSNGKCTCAAPGKKNKNKK